MVSLVAGFFALIWQPFGRQESHIVRHRKARRNQWKTAKATP